jgi:glycosyltransferase involved in cell wall biosynthesis
MVMIEALGCGTPVIAYRYATAPEIVDDGLTGFLCDDMEDLATKLGEARHLDRATCRAAVVDRFITERMVAEHVAVFERVLCAHRARSA